MRQELADALERVTLLELLLERLLIEAHEGGDVWTIERIEAALGPLVDRIPGR